MLYNSGPRTLVRIVEVSAIGGVRFRRFHCSQECLINFIIDSRVILQSMLLSASQMPDYLVDTSELSGPSLSSLFRQATIIHRIGQTEQIS